MRAHQGNQEANHLGGLPDELELLDDCNRRLELEQHPRRRDPKRLASGRLMREAISMHSEAISAEIRNDWRAVDWDTRKGRCAVIRGHRRSSGVIVGSSEIITWYASRPVFGGVEGP